MGFLMMRQFCFISQVDSGHMHIFYPSNVSGCPLQVLVLSSLLFLISMIQET